MSADHDMTPPFDCPDFFRLVVERAVNPYVLIDKGLILRYASPSIELLLGWKPDAWIGRSVAELISPRSLELAQAGLSEITMTSDDPEWVGAPIRLFLRASDNSMVPVDVYARDTGQTGIPGTLVQLARAGASQTMRDAVDTILGGTDVDKALRLLTSLVQHSITGAQAILASGWDGRRFTRVAGQDRILFLTSPNRVDAQAIARVIDGRDQVVDLFADLSAQTRAVGEKRGWGGLWCAPIPRDDGSDPTAALFVWRDSPGPPGVIVGDDINRFVNLASLALHWMGTQKLLTWSASHDHLTGLTNRAEFQNQLDRSAGQPRTILFCDLDDFKPVNEDFGHRAGDRVLKAVAERLRNVCESCLVARVGGDEFAILQLGTPDMEAANHIAAAVHRALADPVAVDDRHAQIGITIGIAVDPDGTVGSDQLMEQADTLLRRGKTRGKNQVLSIVLGDPRN